MAKFKDASPQACEHECMNKTKSFLEYFIHVNKILKKYFLTCKIKSLLTWKNILSVSVDEWYLWMKVWAKMDELYSEC
jgi:hypothetical protein